jgi:hypothetical protein
MTKNKFQEEKDLEEMTSINSESQIGKIKADIKI